jgi:glycosyltransferase involved in cell wall biosynthesis
MIKKKILLLITNLGQGGAQKVFRDQLQFFSEHFQVTGCVFNWDGALEDDKKLNVVSLEVAAGKNVFDKLYQFVVRCIRYRKLKKKLEVDASISHMEGANYVNLLSGGKSKAVLIEHGSKIPDVQNRNGTGGWFRRNVLMPMVYRNADTVVTVSEGLKKELISHFHVPTKQIVVIQNSFDVKAIESESTEPLPLVYEKAFARTVIISSGRLAKQKNQAPLLRILKKVKEQVACCLVLLGNGQLKNDLIELAHQLDLTISSSGNINDIADVYFLGYQQNPFPFLSKATLFVFPSAFEGFPLALCEAMICGVPVVATDCRTGPREILAPNTEDRYENLNSAERAQYGVLMPLLNNDQAIDCWAEEVTQLLTDKKLLEIYQHAGKERMKDFDKSKVVNKWIALLER